MEETIQDLSGDYSFKRVSREGEKSWDDVIRRLIKELVKRNCKTSVEDLEWLLLNYYALPNSPALVTAGTEKFSASACSSYPVYDTLFDHKFSIMGSVGIASKALKAGIGVGFNFSDIRSKEEAVNGQFGIAEGPVGVLKQYSGFISGISQLKRKAACMGLLHVSHPDVEDFIDVKVEDKKIDNFNLSLILDDKFMNAVVDDQMYQQSYIDDNNSGKEIKARELFDKMAIRAWENGEPAFMFQDTIQKDYFEDMKGRILANPCSEALLSWGDDWLELCVLATINGPKYDLLSDEDKKRVCRITTSMLNDIIDVQDYICEEHRVGMKERNRKIGIGVAGLATILAKKGYKYASPKAFTYTKNLFREIGEHSTQMSKELGSINGLDRYNGSIMSQAPTSTLSRIFDYYNEEGCSYGIEPYFSLDEVITNNSFGTFVTKEKIIDYLGGKISHIDCANDLSYREHLRPLEAYYQANEKGITQGCSKTINFKNNVTVEEIKETLIYCWKSGVKAISFYRDGSRQNQTISTKDSYKVEIKRPEQITYQDAPVRPKELECDIYRVQSRQQRWMVFVGLLNGSVYEVFMGEEEKIRIPFKYEHGILRKEKGKYCLVLGEGDDELVLSDLPTLFESREHSTLSRLISMSLRHGVPLKFCAEQLLKDGAFDAINRAVSRVLKKYIKENEDVNKSCPECKQPLYYIHGCPTCKSCGWSKCG